ncbi:MAG: ABC transporter ATP-binding protein [Planctomycetota bacterium]|jgi:ABC-2 type transport system ATP-binding protein
MGLAVNAEGLTFSYGDRAALKGIDFSIAEGKVHGFLGPNGSGKSTLFKILATILPMQGGAASVLGNDLQRDLAALRKRIGVVFQSPALDRKLTLRQNLVYGGHLQGLRGAELSRRVDEMLEIGRLSDRAGEKVESLSGGLRRRVELAKGMLHKPDLLLLDEPSTGLDPGARKDLWSFLGSQENLSVLFTTHLMDEAEVAEELTILHEGEIVASGTPASLKSEIGDEILEIDASDPEALVARLEARNGVKPQILGGRIHVQTPQAQNLLAELMQHDREDVERVAISKPSLEDVFIMKTGHRFWEDGGEGA